MKSTTRLVFSLIATGGILASCDKPKETNGDTGTVPVAATPATPMEQAEQILGKLTSGLEKVVVALESVTDKDSAEAAAATIMSVSAEISALGPQAKDLQTKLSDAEQDAMENAAEAGMKPLMGRMTEVMQKVMVNPETADVLMPAMDAFNQAMAPPADTPASPDQ